MIGDNLLRVTKRRDFRSARASSPRTGRIDVQVAVLVERNGQRPLGTLKQAEIQELRRVSMLDPSGIAFVVLFPFSAVYVLAVLMVRKRREFAQQQSR
jgi:hypothetical protein